MTPVIYDHATHRIIGTVKTRPTWASEQKLKHLLLMPALSQMHLVLEFYSHGKSTIEIARESGRTKHAIRTLMVHVRRALGIGRDGPREEFRRLGTKQVGEKHDQFATGFRQRRASWGSKGRHFHPVINEAQLRELFLQPALQRLEIAKLYWLEGLTARQVAARLGIKKGSAEFQLARIRRLATDPHRRQHVSRAVTRRGETRTGVTAPYTRRQLKRTL